ncbi:hypothetical protein C8R44DRAFT_753812 [Mycena epipterygia]|nr:hypothetical protein C8R44DRAFT_753812 [Mycena epipterygia]
MQSVMPSKLASEAGTPSSAGDMVATSHGSSLSFSAYPLHLQSPGGSTCMDSITSLSCYASADRNPKANKMPVEDAQSTNFIMQNLPELLFTDVQTDSLQYGKVSSSASIKPPHNDLADTETEKPKGKKWQKSTPEQEDSEMLRCSGQTTGQDKILDYGGTASYI